MWQSQQEYMKPTSHIIVITSNYDCYMLNGKGTKPNMRKLNLHIIELESYVGQIIKGYGYARDKNVSNKLNAGDLNVVILHFKGCVRYFSLFLNNKCISSLVRTKYIEKKFNLVVFSSHCLTNIYSLLG